MHKIIVIKEMKNHPLIKDMYVSLKLNSVHEHSCNLLPVHYHSQDGSGTVFLDIKKLIKNGYVKKL